MHKMSVLARITIPVAAAALVLAAATPASSTPTPADPMSASAISVTDGNQPDRFAEQATATLADARTIAAQSNRPVEAVVADLTWQNAVNKEFGVLRASMPSTFGGAAILSLEDHEIWVGFKDASPTLRFPAGTIVHKETNLPVSEAELITTAEQIATQSSLRFSAEVSSVPDARSRVIDLTIFAPTPTFPDEALAQITALAAAEGLDIHVTFDPTAVNVDEDAYGGGRLDKAGTSTLLCTSAFSIIKSGTTGMLTAEHCRGSFTHANFTGGTKYSTYTVDTATGVNGDLRWYNTSTTEKAKFRADYSDLRTIYDSPGFSVGTTMCHFGYGNGKSCDIVYKIGVATSTNSNLIAMEHHRTTGGNSGGPWFFGTSGYGVHKGALTIDGASRAIFTPLNRVMPAFGAYILVG